MTVQLIGKTSGTMSRQMVIGLEVTPIFYKTPLFRIFLLVLILFIIAYPLNRLVQKKLLLQQQDLEKKKLLEQERVRIAMDLHDDIGGNLTALTLMTNLLKQKGVDDTISPLVDKISEASDRMVQDMNEIVWALNITNDSINSLMSYIRQHVSHKLSESQIVFEIKEPLAYPDLFVSGSTRRNVFLIIKEIVNNAVKYSGSQKIEMKVQIGESLKIILIDNGKGLPQELLDKVNSKGGNGLNNIRKRANAIHASIQLLNENGLTVIFELPLEEFPK
jgi:signal transduction histidine kinase